MDKQTRVLLAEDNELVRETIVVGTRAQPYWYCFARDGVEALSAIQRDSFDVIILDVGLPGISGLDVLQQVRDLSLDIAPVIVVSGFAMKAYKERAVKLGAVAYLTKDPLSVDDLISAVGRALESREPKVS